MKLKVFVEILNIFDIYVFYFLFVLFQIVWVVLEFFGVGRVFYDDLCVVVVFYEFLGNMEGLFGDNVFCMGLVVW